MTETKDNIVSKHAQPMGIISSAYFFTQKEMKNMRKRNNQINIRLYDAELDKLNKKVAKSGMPREKFLRNLIAGAEIKPAPPVDFANLIREVRRLGSNVDRLLHYANGKGYISKKELTETMAELDNLEKTMWQAFGPGEA